jgi:putative ABC transport system permease protein
MFNNIIHLQFDLFQIPGYFYLLLFLLTILIGFISGSYPAILTSSFEPYKVLAGFARLSLNHGFRTFLVILQYSVSIALIIITVVIYKQIDYIHSKELGFETSHVVCLQANQLLINKYDIFKQELSKSNLILGVTNGSTKPSSIGNVNPISWEGKPDDERVLCFFHLCDTNFLDFFNMEFVKGRNFSDSNVDSTSNSYIVNETAVRMMNLLEPIGKRFSMYGQDGYIIGVVKDFHFQPLHVPIQPLLFTNKQNWINWVFVRIDGESIPEALHFIENTYHSIVPEFPFKYSFLDDDFEVMYRNFTEMKEIIKYFAILAIIISSLGLFGLILFITRQQQKEVAIRKIHGASVYQIILHFSKKFVVWLSLANLFSYIIAYYFINRILEMFAYHAVISLIIYILPGFFILVFALIIINLQTLKVANVNPSIVLKYE